MTILESHWLAQAARNIVPGGSPMGTRRFLVIHFTAGWLGRDSVDFWRTPAAKGASAHVVIDRDGSIIQCRPFNRTAGHAGKNSKWKDPKTGTVYRNAQINQCSIGIELANCGDLERDVYPSTMGPLAGKPIPRLTAKHKNGGPMKRWEEYTPAQIAACTELGGALVKRYNLDDVVGHDDVAPTWKNDPGPAFPMRQLRTMLGFPPDIAP